MSWPKSQARGAPSTVISASATTGIVTPSEQNEARTLARPGPIGRTYPDESTSTTPAGSTAHEVARRAVFPAVDSGGRDRRSSASRDLPRAALLWRDESGSRAAEGQEAQLSSRPRLAEVPGRRAGTVPGRSRCSSSRGEINAIERGACRVKVRPFPCSGSDRARPRQESWNTSNPKSLIERSQAPAPHRGRFLASDRKSRLRRSAPLTFHPLE